MAHGVLRDIANVERACIFFAAFGSYILNKHYNIASRPVAGGFAICLSTTPNIAFFGKQDDGLMRSATDGFHMWIQTETHVVDFMAPVFPEAFANKGMQEVIPRKMFQRRIAEEAKTPDELVRPGDFFTLPDAALTEALLDGSLNRPGNADLIQIADRWYGRRRGKQTGGISMGNDLGDVIQLKLPTTTASGSW